MDSYIGFLSSKEALTKTKLEDFSNLPVEFLLHKKCTRHLDDFKGKSDVSFYHYLIINKNNDKVSAEIGEFRVIEFGPDSGSFYERHRDVIIEETKTRQSHRLTLPIIDYKNSVNELTAFFRLLEMAGTWDILEIAVNLREENRKLKEELTYARSRELNLNNRLEEMKLREIKKQ